MTYETFHISAHTW